MDDSKALEGRFRDLAERSFSEYIYTFTNFLGESEKAVLSRLSRELSYAGVDTFGGMEYAERVIARFGNEEAFGYGQDYPIVCLKIVPVSKKFSDNPGHRDFLGALMGLGIKRELLGDIIVREDGAYLFCLDHIAGFITENLTKVRNTVVTVSVTDQVPEDVKPRFRELSAVVTSVRLDAVVSHAFGLSRSQSQNLTGSGKVFVNGAECLNSSFVPSEKDVISVRGFGKFIFDGQAGTTGKGRCRIRIRVFS